jgi:MacB-like protein
MPIPDADRVVRLSAGGPQSFVWFNPRGFEVWPAFSHASSFDAVGAYATGELTLLGYNRGRLRAAAVTPEVFDVFKVVPQIGRVFTHADVTSGSFHLAVIGHELWQTHFNGATAPITKNEERKTNRATRRAVRRWDANPTVGRSKDCSG